MGQVWKNWSGSLSFRPKELWTPESEEQVQELVRGAVRHNKKIRVVGAGHSSSPLVETPDFLVSLKHFHGVEEADLKLNQAVVPAGMTVHEAGKDLFRYGLALPNTGDVDVQTLAGAIGTGTHGTGKTLQNLSAMLVGVRMITGTGEILEADQERDPELLKALRLGLGSCGIFLKMKLQLQPCFFLYRREWCVSLEYCLAQLDRLQDTNRNFDFYWYPRADHCKLRIMNEKEEDMPEVEGDLQFDKKGAGHEILPRSRHLKFDEIEYILPEENGKECFMEVRDMVRKKFRREVAWRVLYRSIAADDNFLSPMFGRPSVSISLHHNAGLDFQEYFQVMERLFRKYEGRPHWGKKHNLAAEELETLYPKWNAFGKLREQLDPQQVFLTRYLKKLLIK